MRLRASSLLLCVLLGACAEDSGRPSQPLSREEVEHGRYLASIGNCVACHTASEVAPLAGGVAFAVAGGLFDEPIGVVYSSNISSDRQTGIGDWTLEEFITAMREGRSRDGSHLYPVFPYPHFQMMDDRDLRSLYAYLKTTEPVRNEPREAELPFPFSWRPLLAVWKFLFLPDATDPWIGTATPEAARGAYLVLGVGHCGACHSPRNVFLAERVDARLGGGFLHDHVAEGQVRRWSAINLTPAKAGLAAWSKRDIENYLRTGHSSRAGSFGPMNHVIAGGTRHLTAEDASAIAHFLKSLAPIEEEAFPPPSAAVRQAGLMVYQEHCAECHRDSGRGGFLKAPPLVGSAIVQSADASSLINVILYGAEVDPRLPAPFGAWESMKGFAEKLEDQEVAALASFLRSEWGHEASSIEPTEVARQR